MAGVRDFGGWAGEGWGDVCRRHRRPRGYLSQPFGWDLAPHDLRRTFAKLARSGQAPLEQIQLALGYQNIQTTQRYLGSELGLVDAACDRLGIRIPVGLMLPHSSAGVFIAVDVGWRCLHEAPDRHVLFGAGKTDWKAHH